MFKGPHSLAGVQCCNRRKWNNNKWNCSFHFKLLLKRNLSVDGGSGWLAGCWVNHFWVQYVIQCRRCYTNSNIVIGAFDNDKSIINWMVFKRKIFIECGWQIECHNSLIVNACDLMDNSVLPECRNVLWGKCNWFDFYWILNVGGLFLNLFYYYY